jgi:hypothetical protein
MDKQIPIPTLVGTPGCQNIAPSTWGERFWAKEPLETEHKWDVEEGVYVEWSELWILKYLFKPKKRHSHIYTLLGTSNYWEPL